MNKETALKFERVITEYGNLPFTKQLAGVVFENYQDEKIFSEVCKQIIDYTEQFKELLKVHNISTLLFSIYQAGEEISNNPPAPISCKKGCSFCCHIQVTISKPEADLIKEFCRDNNIAINKKWFKEQRKLNEDSHISSEFKKCAFLKDNQCSIYLVRPFNCRNYFAISPAVMCNPVKFPSGLVGTFVNLEREILHSAFINLLTELKMDAAQDSMARTFLSLNKTI